ncbi:MAG: 30S ribosomal protein S6 [Deltaproteobacteria bacterium]|nr:MAG: 30S ribosomal protein S6 [Deltaproteobacteria bacterium]
MRLYETVFILKPDLTEEETQSWIQRILQVLEQNKGELIRLDEWGIKKLAYRIRKLQKGYYVYAVFLADYACVKELDRHFKMLEPFLRHIIVKLDDRELEKHRQAQQAKEAQAQEAATRLQEEAQAKEEAEPEETQVPEAEEAPAPEETAPEEKTETEGEKEEEKEEKPAEEVSE